MSRRCLALVAACALLPRCDVHEVEDSEVEDYRFETTGGGERARVEVVLDAGSIDVVPSGSLSIEASFRKRVRAFDAEVATRYLDRVEIEAVQDGSRVRLTGRSHAGPSPSFGADLRSELTLRVPEEVDLDLRSGDGRIRLEGVRGSVVARTGDGRIEVRRSSGSFSLRTEDGSIVGEDVSGDVDALTEDGRIELEGGFGRLRAVTSDGRVRVVCREDTVLEGDWVLRSVDGSIGLQLPVSVSAELEAMTSDGRVDNRLSRFEGSESHGFLRGRLGAGGRRIVISTMDGRIELREN